MVAENSSLHHQRRVGAGEVPECLRDLGGVAVHERDRRRTGEQRVELLETQLSGRKAHQGVLEHPVLAAGGSKGAPQRTELTNRQSSVLRQERGARRREPLTDLTHLGDLLWPRVLRSQCHASTSSLRVLASGHERAPRYGTRLVRRALARSALARTGGLRRIWAHWASGRLVARDGASRGPPIRRSRRALPR